MASRARTPAQVWRVQRIEGRGCESGEGEFREGEFREGEAGEGEAPAEPLGPDDASPGSVGILKPAGGSRLPATGACPRGSRAGALL